METSAKVTNCVLAFARAKSDGERCDLLGVVADALKDSDCTANDRRLVLEAIGIDFLTRLLFFDDTAAVAAAPGAAGRPPCHVFQGLALNLLAILCSVPEFVGSQLPMEDQVPQFLRILTDYGFNKEERAMKSDALTCLMTLTASRQSCYSIVQADGMTKLCHIYSQDDARHNFKAQVFSVISGLIYQLGSDCWHRCPADFHVLMNTVTRKFLAEEKSQKKFVMCDVLLNVLHSFPPELRDSCPAEQWYQDLNVELLGILRFKLGDAQREPLLRLCATLVDRLGVAWALGDGGDKAVRIFLLLVQLSCIEVRMILEVREFEAAMPKSDLVTAMFALLELSIQFLIEDNGQVINEQAQLHLCNALTGAFGGIMHFLNLAARKFPALYQSSTELERQFVMACVRVTGSWLAEESSALREDVYQVLPFLLRVAGEEWEHESSACCLRFLLPALCHLSVENPARTVLLQWKIPQLLTKYMVELWTSLLADVSLEGGDSDQGDQHCEDEAENALVTVCGILMNVIVLESPEVPEQSGEAGSEDYANLMQFLFVSLPQIDMKVRHLILRGNLAVLGLLLLRNCGCPLRSSESAMYRYLSASIRFLWDAFSAEDTSTGFSVVVTFPYRSIWNQVKELWFLGMQALSSLLSTMPWIADFVIESGWAKEIIGTLRKASKSGLQDSIRTAYENFLCSLAKCGPKVRESMEEWEALKVCEVHRMKVLGKLLRSCV